MTGETVGAWRVPSRAVEALHDGPYDARGRTCTRCEVPRPIDLFARSPNGRDGLHSHCRLCRNAVSAEYQRRRYNGLETTGAAYRRNPYGTDYVAALMAWADEGGRL